MVGGKSSGNNHRTNWWWDIYIYIYIKSFLIKQACEAGKIQFSSNAYNTGL